MGRLKNYNLEKTHLYTQDTTQVAVAVVVVVKWSACSSCTLTILVWILLMPNAVGCLKRTKINGKEAGNGPIKNVHNFVNQGSVTVTLSGEQLPMR